MKKIATITCHEVYNHGASLQEYALLTYLESLGFEAEAIHYKPPYLSRHFKLSGVSNPKFDKPIIKQLYLLAKLPSRLRDLKRKKAFDNFAKKYIPTGKTLYTTNEELKHNLPLADAYICGSDQIWNSFFENGKDPAFYLDFVPNDKLKISYAASFAIDEITESLKPFVKEKVKRLNFISVRETSGVKILCDLGIKESVQVLDPVFLLETSHWKKFTKNIDEEYIFVYDCDSNPQIKEIAQLSAKKEGIKIFTVDKNIKYANKNFYFESPDFFLSLIYNAKYVLTNSFHALAFSLIFNKKIFVFNRFEKINTRMRDLLKLFGISYLLLNSNEILTLDDVQIDFKEVNARINEEIKKSKIYIENAVINKAYVTKN